MNISELFNNKIFRISDCQRGYSWGEEQLNTLWNDIKEIELSDGKSRKHYLGTIILQESTAHPSESWLYEYSFYKVIDGQQRLTTICILLFELIKSAKMGFCERSTINLYENYIAVSKFTGTSKVYKFGYGISDKNNSFLINSIFEDNRENLKNEQPYTIYLANLINAKSFFSNKLAQLSIKEKESIFMKITSSLEVELRIIEKDADIISIIETINKRGKSLSRFENLRISLLYLIDKYSIEFEDKNHLRKTINDAWHIINLNLAQNPKLIFNQDEFLSDFLYQDLRTHQNIVTGKYTNDANEIIENPYTFDKINDFAVKMSKFSSIWVLNKSKKFQNKAAGVNSPEIP